MKIEKNNIPELIGQFIDIFEDFLYEKGIEIKNPEREDDENEDAAIIYGSDYDRLAEPIKNTLVNWEMIEKDVEEPER